MVASQTVTGLPLTTRNYTNLLGLSAGANASVPNATGFGRGTMDMAVNGAAAGQNTFQMDGVAVNNLASTGTTTEGGTYPTFGIPNPDSLQEFKIQTSQYDAGYGRNPGANVNVITKSGTNEFHGTAFEFFRNTDLNANDFFRNRLCGQSPAVCATTGGNKLVLNQNQFGGVIGGPIKKDKLFFFASYQQTWQKNGVGAQGYATGAILPVIPSGPRNTPAFVAALGSDYCNVQPAAGGQKVNCDGSNINPIALKFLQAQLLNGQYVMPGSPTGAPLPVSFSIPAYDKEYQGMMNIDYVLSSKNTLSLRYYRSYEPQNISFAVPPGPSSPVPGTTSVNPFGYHNGVLKLTTIVTNTIVNEARMSFFRNTVYTQQSPPQSTYAANIYPNIKSGCNLLGCTNPFSPAISISGVYSAIGGAGGGDGDVADNQFQWADQVSWTKGRHNLRFGGEFERVRWNWNYLGLSRGVMAFQTFQDFLIGLPGNCGAYVPGVCNGGTASNILNTSGNTVESSPSGIVHGYRINNANWFAQDDWKATSRLTVNLGVRWEYDGNMSDKYGNLTNLWLSAIQTVPTPATTQVPTPGVYFVPQGGSYAGWVVPSNYEANVWGPLPTGVTNSGHLVPSKNGVPLNNFAPRMGLAWQPTNSNRLVIRTGAGFFYDRVPGNSLAHAVEQSPPYAITLDQSGPGNSFASEAAPFQPIPLGVFPIRWVNFTPGLTPFQQSSSISQPGLIDNYVTPLVYVWNLDVQYALASRWVLELGYVGSRGVHQAEVQHILNGAQIATASNPINGQTTSTTTNALLRVPYLGFSPTGIQMAQTDGDYKFNSLQATLRKQLSYGLTFQAAYTFSRAFTTVYPAPGYPLGVGGLPGGQNFNNPLNSSDQYGLNPQYRPHRFVINYNWNIPSGNLSGFSGKLLSGWSLGGVTTIQDGQPLTVVDNRGGAIFGLNGSSLVISTAQMAPGATYASVATPGGVESRLGGASGGPGYFNTAAFTTIPNYPGTNGTGWGNSGLGILFGPGQFNFDVVAGKTTKVGGIHEDGTLQFRAEFFNFFNHPQFNAPAGVNVAVPNIGQITATSVNPRLIQFALKYLF